MIPEEKMTTIVVNPGHGGGENGCISVTRIPESLYNLKIAHRVVDLLKNYFNVLDTDKAGIHSLKGVTEFANRHEADIFVSIHANSYSSPSVRGLEVFCYPDSSNGYKLAKIIYSSILLTAKVCGGYKYERRGIKTKEFYVLRKTKMPAVLVETGFLSNSFEEKWLNSAIGQITVGYGIARGILEYVEKREVKNNVR